jgi:U3 small nucleolar RNA-associated protein 7
MSSLDKKLRGELTAAETLVDKAALAAAKVWRAASTTPGCRPDASCRAQVEQWLLPAEAGVLEAEGMERTYRFSQEQMALAADSSTRRKLFDLALPLGPYSLDYTPNGRHVVIAGRRGHLALFDWTRPRLVTELQVRETTRCVKFLHNTNFFAAAQEKCVRARSSCGRTRSTHHMPPPPFPPGTCTSTTSGAWRCTA